MEELKPCPFCHGEVSLKYSVSDHYIDCPTCERHHWEADIPCKYPGKDGLIEWWNTRAERTCKTKLGVGGCFCSNCGVFIFDKAIGNAVEYLPIRFCPWCGAKVENGS